MVSHLQPNLGKDQVQQLWYSCLNKEDSTSGITPEILEKGMYGLEVKRRNAGLIERAAAEVSRKVGGRELEVVVRK